DRSSGRSDDTRSDENIETVGDLVRHRAHEIVRSRNEREETRMIDVQVVRENIALELGEKFIGIASSFRRIVIEQGNYLRQIGFRADWSILHVRKMFGQKIDN